MAVNQNISPSDDFFTGEDKSLPFRIFQADGVTPQDTSGWTASWMLKRLRLDADVAALITKTTSSGIAWTAPLTGDGVLTLSDDDIAAIKADALYFHELKRTDAGF